MLHDIFPSLSQTLCWILNENLWKKKRRFLSPVLSVTFRHSQQLPDIFLQRIMMPYLLTAMEGKRAWTRALAGLDVVMCKPGWKIEVTIGFTGLQHCDRIQALLFCPKEHICAPCLHSLLFINPSWDASASPVPRTLFNNTSVVFSITKLTSADPEAPSAQASLYVAMSEHHYASDTAPRGESSRCTLWRCASHFRYLSQLLCKMCDAAAVL